MTPPSNKEEREKYNKIVLEELDKALVQHPDGKEAVRFMRAFGQMCHQCDDIIDEESFRNNPEEVLKLTHMCLQVYSSTFYQKYVMELYSIISIIHDIYANSVQLERSSELWKKEFADALRNTANYVPVYIVKILVSYEASRVFSMMILHNSYDRHHNELGKPI